MIIDEILIQTIKTSRTREHGDPDLMMDIVANGLKVPVLLDPDHNLIDGLRRIAAFDSLERDTIPAVVATTYEQAMEVLKLVYGPTNPITDWARAWQINKATDALLQARSSRLRSKYGSVPVKQRGTVPKEPKSRELFNDAMGTVYVTKAAELYRATEKGLRAAQAIVKRLEAGELTVNAALHRLHEKSLRLTGNVVEPAEQELLLSETVRGLSGLVKGLKKLDAKVVIPAKQYEPLMKELKEHRADLISLIRHIEKGYHTK